MTDRHDAKPSGPHIDVTSLGAPVLATSQLRSSVQRRTLPKDPVAPDSLSRTIRDLGVMEG
jgi:hypothetical protein